MVLVNWFEQVDGDGVVIDFMELVAWNFFSTDMTRVWALLK